MPTESEEFEHKSQLEWAGHQKFDIAKTLIAFANCQGWTILIEKFIGNQSLLDSARLDDFVNKYCAPRISNITSNKIDSEKWEIQVPPSPLSPHVICQEGSYNDKYGKPRSAFYPGQIYVRHSSKSEPASGEDVQKLIQQIVGSWLSKLGKSIETLSTRISDDLSSLPVRIVEQGGDMTLEIKDVTKEYPYYATNLAKEIGRTAYWVGRTANAQNLKMNPKYCYEINGPSGRALYIRYSEAALQKLKSLSEQEKASGD